MKKKHYLSKNERELIDSEYKKKRVYSYLKALALKADEGAQYFSLSGEDLLYYVMYEIDGLIGMIREEDEAILYCNSVWQELRMHFAEHIDCGEEDKRLAATLIVCATRNLLLIGNKPKYWMVCDTLQAGATENDNENRKKIEAVVDAVFYNEDAYNHINVWMRMYEEGPECMSDDIGDKISEVRESLKLLGIENKEELINVLKEFFWNNEDSAEEFIYEIHGKGDDYVINAIKNRTGKYRKEMMIKNKKKLWTILHDKKLYGASYPYFARLLK